MKKAKSDQPRVKADKAAKKPDKVEKTAAKKPTAKELNNLLNELKIQQAELEMQNEELQKSQQELEKARDQYWHLFNSAPVGTLILNKDCQIVKANATFADMIGKSADDLQGVSFRQFVAPEDLDGLKSCLASTFKNQAQKTFELYLASKKEKFCAILSGNVITSENGDSDKVLVNVTNISGKKKLEEEQKKFEDRMGHFQRLESLGILAGGIAHDFNNLLTIIRGNSEMSLLCSSIGPEVKSYLHEIIVATDRASKLTNQMLAYAGQGEIDRKVIDLSAEIEEIVPLIQGSVSPEIDLKFDLAKDCRAECDLNQMKQLVMNTVLNASEAIFGAGGKIFVRSYMAEPGKEPEENFAFLPQKRLERCVCIEISDNGAGMEKEVMERIFDPFYSTKLTGRGLGMAAVLGIVKGHNGAVWIKSSPKAGSTFRFYLPARAEEKAVRAAPRKDALERSQSFSGLALITEDEPIIRRLMENFLKTMGFDVHCVENGLEGVKFLKKNQKDLSLAIVDMVMPEMNGKDFFLLLRQRYEKVPVVFCSGYSFDFVPEKIRTDPNAGFVQKPFSWKSMEKEIVRLFGR